MRCHALAHRDINWNNFNQNYSLDFWFGSRIDLSLNIWANSRQSKMNTTIVMYVLASFAIIVMIVPLMAYAEPHPFRPVTPIEPIKDNSVYTSHEWHPFRH